MKTSKVIVKVCCFLVLLVVCIVPIIPFKAIARTFAQSNTENCVIGLEKIAGQANAVIGGATGDSTIEEPPPDEVVVPDWIDQAVNLIGDSAAATDSVSVLIVDDFSQDDSHGYFVYDVSERLLASLPQSYQDKITLRPVNIGAGYITSQLVVQILDEYISQMDLSSSNIVNMVWNLSFALIPCQDTTVGFDMNQFLEQNDQTLIEYLSNNGTEDGVAKTNQLVNDVDTTVLDPLRQAIKSFYVKFAPNSRLFPVSAAGNLNRTDSLYPGAWPEIVSVGASYFADYTEQGAVLQDWNYGEVTTPGRWYPTNVPGANYIAGTSFASPGFSLLMAAYLSNSQTQCTFMNMINPSQQIFGERLFYQIARDYNCP